MKIIRRYLKVWLFPLLVTLIVFLLMKFVFLFGYVPTASMEPTLEKESLILGSRFFSSLETGDVIIFEHEGRLLVKRIAALPGEMIDLNALTYMEWMERPVRETDLLTVPENSYFVLGDNVQDSYDSRYWEDPFIKRSSIVAKLIYPMQ